MATTPVVCLPVKLDAYVLNPSACGTFPEATLAPLAQPNFTFLRLDSELIEPDVLPFHDLHNASPASANPRLTDLATGKLRPERQGVYLHWMLPRVYRSGAAEQTAEGKSGLKKPNFRAAPDRWLVVRRLHPGFQPSSAMSAGKLKWIEAWVVESNRVRNITDLGLDIDVELECAPFVVADNSGSVDSQAEIFIGAKTPLGKWTEARSMTGDDASFVRLDVAGAANPLFADFTSHNSNVFSILDNFAYKDAKDNTVYLTQATASYYVLGWHSRPEEDNLNNLGGTDKTIADVFRESFLELKDKTGVNLNTFPECRAVCHGAMYGVKYQPSTVGITVPAHDAGKKLGDKDSHPVTVGTTPLDAVLAYIRSHEGSTTEVEDDILHLETLLLKQEDDIDSQQEALDMLTANNFKPSQDNGYRWHFSVMPPDTATGGIASSKKTNQGFVPTVAQSSNLATLNALQAALDGATRELRQARWELFAKWWNFSADGSLVVRKGIDNLKLDTQAQAGIVRSLEDKVGRLTDAVETAKKPLVNLVEKGSQTPFNRQNDPTILVPGVENPWPIDWLKNLKVRLNSQVEPQPLPGTLPESWVDLGTLIKTEIPKRLPKDFQGAASNLLSEFFNLHPNDDPTTDKWAEQPSKLLPVYHDHVTEEAEPKEGAGPDGVSRDRWNARQPFFPLFLEFEVRYYHLEKELWEFGTPDIDPVPGNPPRTRYGLASDVNGKTQDERVIRGRVLVLPQPGFLLSTNIQRLFNATASVDLPPDLRTEAQQKELLAKVEQMAYLSSPMVGFTDHLITLVNGTHIKPTIREPGKALQPLKAAINAGLRAGFDGETIKLMGIETTKTPYADYASFADTIDPLKPVAHGQFKFTRLDIFDKFGQAISAINPAPANRIPAIYPALSEYFHPQRLPGDDRAQANTVGRDPYSHCQFAQFPHTINQDARINASFLRLDDDTTVGWRPCTEWENPVWGILVVNYAEYALQVFLPDGTFYREVRLGGPSGATETPAWKPFAPPSGTSNGSNLNTRCPQLDKLITRLRDEKYLRAFIRTINASLAAVPHTPNQYSQFLSAVVGRPLALANFGFSLELATPPAKSQSSTSRFPQPARPKLLDYEFPVKIGDKDRLYDGLVGYFNPQPGAMAGKRAAGDELDLSELLTYYDVDADTNTTAITPANYPRISPYHLSAQTLDLPADPDPKTRVKALARPHWQQLRMVGALFDPFSKVHLYSGILPIASLQLPQWSLQEAMQRMTAFFHMGPLLVTDVRGIKYDASRVLRADRDLNETPGDFKEQGVGDPVQGEGEGKGKSGEKEEKPVGGDGTKEGETKPIGGDGAKEKETTPVSGDGAQKEGEISKEKETTPVGGDGAQGEDGKSKENETKPVGGDGTQGGDGKSKENETKPVGGNGAQGGDEKSKDNETTPSKGDAAKGGDEKSKGKVTTPPGIAIPAIRSAEWNWLAPFVVETTVGTGKNKKTSKNTQWNPFGIAELDNKPRFEKGPYMAIEGYLQLKHPITAPDTI